MLFTQYYPLYIKINEDEITTLISGTQNWFSSSDWVCCIVGTLFFFLIKALLLWKKVTTGDMVTVVQKEML